MSLSVKTQKMLWGRAAGRCSHPSCRVDVFYDETEATSPTLVGENCHIAAESDNGPRANPSMPTEERNAYPNLILMCRNHHRIIDDPENGEKFYPVERLHEMKLEHEAWVRDKLNIDGAKQADDELYGQVVDRWEQLCHVDDWLNWSSWVLSGGQPELALAVSKDLEVARAWLLNRVWPGRYRTLEESFDNFRHVLEVFHRMFLKQAEPADEWLMTSKFYKIREWDEELYHRLLQAYDYHVGLVQDLMLELTRAANFVCDEVRRSLLHSYRREQGRLMVQTGPNNDLSYHTFVPQYALEELKDGSPFKGLETFRNDRATRDRHFGGEFGPQDYQS